MLNPNPDPDVTGVLDREVRHFETAKCETSFQLSMPVSFRPIQLASNGPLVRMSTRWSKCQNATVKAQVLFSS